MASRFWRRLRYAVEKTTAAVTVAAVSWAEAILAKLAHRRRGRAQQAARDARDVLLQAAEHEAWQAQQMERAL